MYDSFPANIIEFLKIVCYVTEFVEVFESGDLAIDVAFQ